MMNKIFQELIAEGVTVVYLDDILIFTETIKEHREVTCRVMELLSKHKLFLKLTNVNSRRPRWSIWGSLSPITWSRWTRSKLLALPTGWP
jgi:hypothetical protein